MASSDVQRKLIAVFVTDVAGYSRLMGDDPDATVRTLTAYRAVFASHIERFQGRLVNAPGDSILAEFSSVVDAVSCAVDIQQELAERNAGLPEHRRMHFRIGVNLGDVLVKAGELFGDGVNIAARLEALADPGGVCISRTVFDQVDSRLSLAYEYLGEHRVKNIAKPVRAYRILSKPTATAHIAVGANEAMAINRRKIALAVAVVFLVATGGYLAWNGYKNSVLAPVEPASSEGAGLPLPARPSIAVLPFTNMSGDPDQEYFSDGITEDIITDLSRVRGLFVIARNSTFTYKGKAVKAQQIGRELGVRFMLEGSVRKSGKQLRITAQLIDATTGNHLWAERYDRLLEDVFAVQDEISRKIVTALEVKLTEKDKERSQYIPSGNIAAYDLYLRGLELKARYSPESNLQAREKFSQAIELDPKYAAAYKEKGYTYFIDWALQWNTDPAGLEKVHDLARKCIDLNSSVSGCHSLMSGYRLWKMRHDQAIEAARKAVALNPNDAGSRSALAEALVFSGRPDEGLAEIKLAKRLDPYYPFFFLWTQAHAYYMLREYDEAIGAFERVLTRNPNFMPANYFLAALYAELGKGELAEPYLAKIRGFEHRAAYIQQDEPILPYKREADLERLRKAFRKLGEKF